MILQSILDYAKAQKTLTNKASSDAAKARAANTQFEVKAFFAEGRDNPWLDLSEFNLEWLSRSFRTLADDPVRLAVVAKLRYAD